MKTVKDIVISTSEPPVNNVGWLKPLSNGTFMLYFFSNNGWTPISVELEEKVDNLDKEVGNIQKDVAVLNSKAVIELEIGNSESVKANNLTKLQAIQSVDHLFFADIDYGYGAAKWLPTTGGEAFIVTSSGRAVIYTIGKDGSVTKASTDIDLTNPNTDLFEIVTELPTENISTSKLYCVLSSKVGEENKYTEYAYIKQTDGQFAWEKMGEFKAEPDLSGYAKLDGATFRGKVNLMDEWAPYGYVIPTNNKYFWSRINDDKKAYVSNGDLADIGTKETFSFTLEDGSTVNKSIRVISTTSQAGA